MKLFTIPWKFNSLVILMVFTISLLSGSNAFGSVCQGERQVQDTSKKGSPVIKFEKIPVHSLPKYSDVQWVFAKSGLGIYCEKYKIDQMEKDLMFAKTGSNPFKDFKEIKFKNGSDKRFMDIFPEKNLYDFWETARQVLRKYNN